MRVEDLKGKKLGGLVSGGLDSCTITHWLRAQGAEPHCYTVDLGQPDEPDLEAVQRDGIDVLFHGATGRGNDQVRFQLATNMLAPQMQVYAPWRDPTMLDTFGGRKEMVEYARAYGLPIKASVEQIYSTDANMLGLTHEAGQLEDLATPATLVTPEMGVWAWDAPDEPAFVRVTWKAGRPVAFGVDAKTRGRGDAEQALPAP